MGENVCPVCGYGGLREPPFSGGEGSYALCPCRGFQPGSDGFSREGGEGQSRSGAGAGSPTTGDVRMETRDDAELR